MKAEVYNAIKALGGTATKEQVCEFLRIPKPYVGTGISDALLRLYNDGVISRDFSKSKPAYSIKAPLPERNVIQIVNGRARRVKA